MRRALLPGLAASLARCSRPRRGAHPLGNFSVNHLDRVRVSERPRRRPLHPRPGRDPDLPGARARRTRRCCGASRPRSQRRLRADRRRPRVSRCAAAGARRSRIRAGQGGLQTTRVELPLSRRASRRRARVALRDGTFPGRVGWKAIVARAGRGHRGALERARRPTPPAGCAPTRGRCSEPARRARRRRSPSRPGDGTLQAPDGARGGRAHRRSAPGDGFAGVFARRRRRARACCCCCCSPRSAGARCTRSRRATARRWSPPTWSARAGPRATRSRSARP